jgi:hypothetical protein
VDRLRRIWGIASDGNVASTGRCRAIRVAAARGLIGQGRRMVYPDGTLWRGAAVTNVGQC